MPPKLSQKQTVIVNIGDKVIKKKKRKRRKKTTARQGTGVAFPANQQQSFVAQSQQITLAQSAQALQLQSLANRQGQNNLLTDGRDSEIQRITAERDQGLKLLEQQRSAQAALPQAQPPSSPVVASFRDMSAQPDVRPEFQRDQEERKRRTRGQPEPAFQEPKQPTNSNLVAQLQAKASQEIPAFVRPSQEELRKRFGQPPPPPPPQRTPSPPPPATPTKRRPPPAVPRPPPPPPPPQKTDVQDMFDKAIAEKKEADEKFKQDEAEIDKKEEQETLKRFRSTKEMMRERTLMDDEQHLSRQLAGQTSKMLSEREIMKGEDVNIKAEKKKKKLNLVDELPTSKMEMDEAAKKFKQVKQQAELDQSERVRQQLLAISQKNEETRGRRGRLPFAKKQPEEEAKDELRPPPPPPIPPPPSSQKLPPPPLAPLKLATSTSAETVKSPLSPGPRTLSSLLELEEKKLSSGRNTLITEDQKTTQSVLSFANAEDKLMERQKKAEEKFKQDEDRFDAEANLKSKSRQELKDKQQALLKGAIESRRDASMGRREISSILSPEEQVRASRDLSEKILTEDEKRSAFTELNELFQPAYAPTQSPLVPRLAQRVAKRDERESRQSLDLAGTTDVPLGKSPILSKQSAEPKASTGKRRPPPAVRRTDQTVLMSREARASRTLPTTEEDLLSPESLDTSTFI